MAIGEDDVSGQALLRDLVEIPQEVHSGDYVLKLTSGIGEKSTITDYVVTPQLAGDFDRALGLIKAAIEQNASQAAYLDGSFGSGKSHFMAVLHAILSGDPDAREKKGLADVVHKHDSWLAGRRFLLVPYHIVGAQTLDAVILGGYVAHIAKEEPPGTPVPAVFRDDGILADARDLRARAGDAELVAQLPAADPDWQDPWTSELLDRALSAPYGDKARRDLVSALLSGPFRRYASAVSGDKDSYIPLDEGLSVISKHAREVLGYDAVVLMLDELVLWLANHIADSARISAEAAKVSKLVESAEHERPAPIVSFVPRQRDLRDLVRKDAYGVETTSLFDTLKYWDGRFDSIRLDDKNLPAIVHERLLRPKNDAARATLDDAFARSTAVPQQIWDILLNTHGEQGDRQSFRLTYPFSPAFTHAMVDISGALQRQRTALKLMQQLLIDYRDTLPVGQLMPLGAIFEVLAAGSDQPFSEKLVDEFEKAKRFYTNSLRPWLLARYKLTEDQAAGIPPTHGFRGADLVVKTLLLSALVPNVPALKDLTATKLWALNHGSIVTMLPNQERRLVTQTINELSAQFGEIRVSGNPDDPRVELALIGVDIGAIISRAAGYADDAAARRALVRELLWKELRLSGENTFEQSAEVAWRGTARRVDVLLENVRDRERMPSLRFQPDPDTIRLLIDYPWDDANFSPADDLRRIHTELQPQLGNVPTIFWLPHFLSDRRKEDLATLIAINYALERDRLTEFTPHLTADDRLRARTLLEGRRSALVVQLTNALSQAYGVYTPDDINLGVTVAQHVETLVHGLELRLPLGLTLRGAFDRLCYQLLDHRYPSHPDFDPTGRGALIKTAELEIVLAVADKAAQDTVGRCEVVRGDIPVMKKIANPLKLGVMHEAHFVLGHDWPELISRRAVGKAKVTVSDIREWIKDAQPGLPLLVQNLLIACYAIQADKAWIRSGGPIDPPWLQAITEDMELRSQELPTDEEWELAMRRAQAIFHASKQPVRSTRSVRAVARAVTEKGNVLRDAVDSLAAELAAHARTLGLDAESPRTRTSQAMTTLLARLAAAPDATTVLRELAAADLARDNAIYQVHLDRAGQLAATLRDLRWDALDDMAARTDADGQPEAAAIIGRLRDAAGRDEHAVRLAPTLDEADRAAFALIRAWSRTAAPDRAPGSADGMQPGGSHGARSMSPGVSAGMRDIRPGGSSAGALTTQGPEAESRSGLGTGPDPGAGALPRPAFRGRGRDVVAALADIQAEIQAAADASPDAEFEITWRIVGPARRPS
jgi:hypothetical protein